jgi:hypothetical protein
VGVKDGRWVGVREGAEEGCMLFGDCFIRAIPLVPSNDH